MTIETQDRAGAGSSNDQRFEAAAMAIVSFAADEFERIAAAAQTLQLLMHEPRFYSAPWMAAAQLSIVRELAERAAANIDQIAEGVGMVRDKSELQSILSAALVTKTL